MKMETLFILFFLLGNILMADPLHEYGVLLEQLKNYNTPGFFIINDVNSWQRKPLLHTDHFQSNIIDLVPLDKGFFQFYDTRTEKLVYSRNAILSVNHEGIVCNIDGYPIYPFIKIDGCLPYTLSYRANKIVVGSLEEGIIEEHDIFLYWPKEVPSGGIYGVYFYFDDVDILHDAQTLYGFIDNSSVNVQLTLVKMMKLVSEIQDEYTGAIIYEAGSAEAVLAILQSLLTVSYLVKADPPIYLGTPEERQRVFLPAIPGILPEKEIELPKKKLNFDPLMIGYLYNYLQITSQ
jgi:hypothetical protein